MSRHCLIIAGEKSGQEHVMSFLPGLMQKEQSFKFFGVGGDTLKEQGMDLIYHLDDFSTWGITEALSRIPFYLNAAKKIVEEVERRQCKVAILVDFQTFNLKLAEKLKKKGVTVLYYVAPQAWAWKSWRTKSLARFVDTLFCIIPFEKKWFKDRGVQRTVAVKHPLYYQHIEQLKDFKRTPKNIKTDKLQLLILPGSRDSEVRPILPTFIKAAQDLSKTAQLDLAIVKSSSVNEKLYAPYDKYFTKVYRDEKLVDALKDSDFCFAASGTVTLTCALYSLPTIVGYTSGLLNTFIYENFVKYRGYISLANIIHQSEVFPELIGESLSEFNVLKKAQEFLKDQSTYVKKIEKLNTTLDLIEGDDIDLVEYLAKKMVNSYE